MDTDANATKPSSESHHHHKAQPSTSQLMSSAKVVADAAKSTLHHDAVDKAKVAGAVADLLGAASHYGKLEETSFVRYVEQAEGYLHKYQQSSSSSSSSSSHLPQPSSSLSSMEEGDQQSSHSSSSSTEGGYGDYLKLAQEFLKKR